MLAHEAEYEALAAVGAMRGKPCPVNRDAMPGCIFTEPEIATVGLTEEEARGRGLSVAVGKAFFLGNGMARAMGLALLADKLPAAKAADWGLIWECVADAEFAGRIDTLARQLAAAPTKALVRTRQAMQAAPTHTLEQQLSMEGGFMRELGWSEDCAEGVAAFLEKRPARFTGR